MNRTGTGLCIAACGLAVTLGAQSSTTDRASTTARSGATSDITITGCLAKDARGNYMLTNARMEPVAGAVSGTSGATASTTTTKPASRAAKAGTDTAKAASTTATKAASGTETAGEAKTAVGVETWRLNGNASDLDRHMGHKIRVIGRADESARTTTAAPDTVEHSATSTAKPATTTAKPATTTGATAKPPTTTSGGNISPEHRLDVRAVTMVSPSCP